MKYVVLLVAFPLVLVACERDRGQTTSAEPEPVPLAKRVNTAPAAGCTPHPCGGRLLACGDCVDNDGDGLVDAEDPGCIGACDPDESN